MQNGTTGNIPPFSIHEPFELDSSAPQDSNNIPQINRQHRDQNELLRFKSSNHSSYQNQSHYGLSNSNLSRSLPSSHPYHKMNLNGSFYGQVNIHHTRTTENQRSSSFSFPHHPSSIKFTLPSPMFSRPTVPMAENKITHTSPHCSRKTQVNYLSEKNQKKYSVIFDHVPDRTMQVHYYYLLFAILFDWYSSDDSIYFLSSEDNYFCIETYFLSLYRWITPKLIH